MGLSSELAGTLRCAAGLSHQQFAELTGLSRMTIYRMEAGKIDPRISTLEAMAHALDMEVVLIPCSSLTEKKAAL